ncbi:MAG: HIT domain-containing protein [Elusimicrobia bacterium]|nr:HIT domain-containing protein [Elusimicrobiota bacterium]
MSFSRLSRFITTEMRMSHIYQPVMLISLLKNNGLRSSKDIAREILKFDESQLEYYEEITKKMPGKVLSNHHIVERRDNQYVLKGYQDLNEAQLNGLIELCQQRLHAYIDSRKDQLWKARVMSLGYISGKLRYAVLKAAQFHCELCGVSHNVRALEVDHILPRKHGGTDHPSNLQALCWRCNSMKGARDDTDFRKEKERAALRREGCPFCRVRKGDIVQENPLAFAVYDKYPVTQHHALLITRRHVETYFELSHPELKAVNDLALAMKARIEAKDPAVRGFNLGANAGAAAGQTVMHLHVHLIPRRPGDMEDPRGGVRHVIPGKGRY